MPTTRTKQRLYDETSARSALCRTSKKTLYSRYKRQKSKLKKYKRLKEEPLVDEINNEFEGMFINCFHKLYTAIFQTLNTPSSRPRLRLY